MRYKVVMNFMNENDSKSYFQIFWRWALWSIAFVMLFLMMAEILRVSLSGNAFFKNSYLLQKMESILPGNKTYSGSSKQWAHNEIWNFSAVDLECQTRGQACLRHWDASGHAWLPSKLSASMLNSKAVPFFQANLSFLPEEALTWPLMDESSRPWVVLSSVDERDPLFHLVAQGQTQNSYFFETLSELSSNAIENLPKYLFFTYNSEDPSEFTSLQVSQMIDCSQNGSKCGQEGLSSLDSKHIYWIQVLPGVDVSHLIPQVPEGLYKFSHLQQGFGLFPLGLEKHAQILKQADRVFGKFLDVVQWKVEKNFGSSDFQLIQKSLLNQDILPMRKNIGSYGSVIVYQPKTQQWSLDLLAEPMTSDLQMSIRERIPLSIESHFLATAGNAFQNPIYFHQPEKGGVFWSTETNKIQGQEIQSKFVWGLRWQRKFANSEDQFFIPLSYIERLEQGHSTTNFKSLETMEESAPSELYKSFVQKLSQISVFHGKDFSSGELSVTLEGQLCQEWQYRPLLAGTMQVYQIPKVFSSMHGEGISDPAQVLGIRSGMQVISWQQEFQRIQQAESFQEIYNQLKQWSKFEWRMELGQDIPLILFSDKGSSGFKNKAFQKALQLSKRPTEENWISFLSEMEQFHDQICDSQENWIWDLWPIPKLCKLSNQISRRFSSYISPVINFDLFKSWVQKQLILNMTLEWEEQLDFQFRSGVLPVQKVECRQPLIQNLNWKNEHPELLIHLKGVKDPFHLMESMAPDQWIWIFKEEKKAGIL